MAYAIGTRVLARVDYRDRYEPATIVDPSTFNCFVGSGSYAVEFDRRPIGSAGTYNGKRITVARFNVKAA